MERRRILVAAAAVVAVIGAILVVVYAHDAGDRASRDYAMVTVVEAQSTIPAGESFGEATDAGKLKPVQVVKTDVVGGAITDVTAIDRSEVAQGTIYPGEQIVTGRFGDVTDVTRSTTDLVIPDGDIAVSLSLSDPGRVAGFVTQGSHVALFATSPTYSRILLPNVLVIGVGSTALTDGTASSSTGSSTSSTLPSTLLTVAVPQADAQKIFLAQSATPVNQLAFGLLNTKSKISKLHVTDPGNLFQ